MARTVQPPNSAASAPFGRRTIESDYWSAEPTLADLAEIEAEWPVIEAELAVVGIEAAIASRGSSALAQRRLRRAEARVERQWQDFHLIGGAPLDGAA